MYISRRPGSDMLIEEFFARFGLDGYWAQFRANVLGPTNPFIATLVTMALLFLIGWKADSKSLQIISGFGFIAMLVLKLMII